MLKEIRGKHAAGMRLRLSQSPLHTVGYGVMPSGSCRPVYVLIGTRIGAIEYSTVRLYPLYAVYLKLYIGLH